MQDLRERDVVASDYDFEVNSTVGVSGILDPTQLELSNEQQRRFHTAMRFLDLEPKVYAIQVVNDRDNEGAILTSDQKLRTLSANEIDLIRARLKSRAKGKAASSGCGIC